jgi:hypothetical protein
MASDDPDMPMESALPSPDEAKGFVLVHMGHKRKEFRYGVLVPDGWYQQPPPPGDVDVRKEGEFLSLGVFTPTKDFVPPLVFAVAVRPAPRKGSVAEWYELECHRQGLALDRIRIRRFAFGVGVDGVALQGGDVPMKLRIVMFEDGGRLWTLTAMAPVKLFEPAIRELSAMLLTFELDHPAGQTAPVAPLEESAGDAGDAPAP